MKKLTSVLTLLLLVLLPGCTQRAKANQAIEALQKIRAATEIGVSRFEYKRLLIEAKPKVEAAKLKLPSGNLKSKLDTAMFFYEEAGRSWDDHGEFSKEIVRDHWGTANKALAEIE